MGFTGVKRLKSKPRGELVAALDIGTTKIVCFIARIDDAGEPRIHRDRPPGLERGLRAGAIVDMEAAETAIAHAVHAAEQMAGETVREVIVNLSGGHPSSQTLSVDVSIAGHAVSDADLRRVLRAHTQAEVPSDSRILHAIPVNYTIDGNTGIRDPRGHVRRPAGRQPPRGDRGPVAAAQPADLHPPLPPGGRDLSWSAPTPPAWRPWCRTRWISAAP